MIGFGIDSCFFEDPLLFPEELLLLLLVLLLLFPSLPFGIPFILSAAIVSFQLIAPLPVLQAHGRPGVRRSRCERSRLPHSHLLLVGPSLTTHGARPEDVGG